MSLKEDLKAFVEANKDLRNPIITVNGLKIGIIGDVHIGKTFRTGVPKDRLGERESMVLNQLTELLDRDVDYNILVGDLFDKVRVSNSDLYNLINIIENAVSTRTDVVYVVVNGNHDMPKEVGRISSFQLFEKYFERTPFDNLKIVSKHNTSNIHVIPDHDTLLYFSHYNAFSSLDEEIDDEFFNKDLFDSYSNRIAFGHWETIDFGSDHFIDRDVPKIVLDNFTAVITGHEHKPKLTLIQNVPVLTSGSMQPYAYGEELSYEKDFYVTLPSSVVKQRLKKDPNTFKDAYVKILVETSEDLIDPFDCLGRAYKNVSKKSEESKEAENPVLTSTEPLSFQKSLITLLKNVSIANSDNHELLEHIEKTFLDKSYKENT